MNLFNDAKEPFFIAEVSSNHSQNLERCIEFVNVSAEIGCDAVKFQFFRVDDLFSKEAINANPDILIRKNWELPMDFVKSISHAAKKNKISFGISPFSIDSVQKLNPYVDFFKIASYELLWHDLILECIKTEKPLILSTGMSNIEEIQSTTDFIKEHNFNNYSLLHCTSAYPTPPNDCNLAAIETLRDQFNCKVGWSDHSVSDSVILRSIYKWNAEIIEFHLDLEGNGAEFGSGHCWLPQNMKKTIERVQIGMNSDGDGKKIPVESEISDRDWRADPSDGLRPMKYMRSKL